MKVPGCLLERREDRGRARERSVGLLGLDCGKRSTIGNLDISWSHGHGKEQRIDKIMSLQPGSPASAPVQVELVVYLLINVE